MGSLTVRPPTGITAMAGEGAITVVGEERSMTA